MVSADSIIITSKLLNASTYQNISFNSESVIINQNKFLCLDLHCNISSFDLEASKVVLYFYENGNSNTSVEIYKCSSGGITSGNPINYQTSLISGKRRFMVDVSNEILPNFNGHHYFAIKSINNFSIFVGLLSLYRPYATFDTINIFDFYYHNYYEPRHLNYSLKNDDFSINLFSGAIDYFNELASVNNKLYSFKLLINYHSNMYGLSSVHNYQTYLPNGWKFSFQQFIVSYLNNKYIYIDENNKRHIFSSFKTDNDYEYYFDTCGGYLILKKDLYSGAFEIMLPNKEILTFSNVGYLTSHKLNTRNKDVTIKFQYSNNRISNISCLNDNVNKILFSFFYLDNGINIKVFNDSNKIISLNFNNNDLSYISYQDGSTLSYIYNNHYLISASYKNVKIDFTYDNKNRISSISKNNNYLSATNDFDLINKNIYYLNHLSKVETIINNLSSFKRTYIYEYDDNLDAINEFELYNDDISGAISNIHQNNKHSSYFSNSSVIGKIIDNNNHEINYINNPIILSDSSIHELRIKVINSKILPVLYFILKTTSSNFLDSVINISLLYNEVSFYSKNITITSKYNISTLFIPFTFPSDVNDYDSIKLKINRVGFGANIEINDIKLLFQKSEEMLEVSNLYGTSIPLGVEDNNLYLLNQSMQVIYGDNITANISINFDDLLYSILINKIYNLNVLFTNFGKNILLNIISINNVPLNEIIIGKISYAPTYYKENNNPNLLRSSYHLSTFKYDNQNLKFLSEEIGYEFITSYRSVKQYIIDLFLQIEKVIDFNHNEETTHSYNDYGSSAYSLLLRKVVVNNVIESSAYLKTNQLSYSSNGELLTSINTKIDNNNYFDIVYTYDNYFNLINIKNDQLNEYYIYYDYYNNDLLKSVYRLNSNLEEISKTNIIYSQGQIEEINNDYLTYNYLNSFSYIYQKDNEMSSLTWNNNVTYYDKYMNLDTIYNDIIACFIQDDKETIYDYHGNTLYNSSSFGAYSLSYFYRDRSESLEDVIYENRVSKLDDLLGGEFDHFTNILKEYEYDIYDNISKIKVRKLANLNDYYISSTYIDDNDYDLEISYSYDVIDAYFGVFINQCIKDKYQTREEKVFNNYVNDMGPFKSNIYYSNYPNNIIHKISDNLYHGLNNASSVYDEFIKDDDLNNVHTYQKRHYFNSDNETNHHTSFINNEVLEVCNNNIYPPSLIKTINYCYDNHGYINQISSDSSSYNFSHQYTYLNNRLVSDNSASFGNKQYLYNVLGNITSIIINNNHSYTFYYGSNSDSNNFKNNQISSFYHDGNHYYFSYDNNGFPTLYKNINVLFSNKKLTNYGDVSFSYDSYNKRISKVVANNQEILYIYQLDKLIYEIRKVNNIQTVIEYIYGVNDIIGFKYQGNYYIYHKDILGNIVAIYSSGSLVAKYDYDAYGNHIVYNADGTINNNPSFIGNINPFRYRGYYFDVETGLYYLQYRYYDPEIGRFISPDSFGYIEVDKINGTNLYIYCYNNPIMYKDPSGHMSALAAAFILGLIGATVGFAAQSLTDLGSGKGFDWRRSLISAGAGFVGGMVSAIPFWGQFLSVTLTPGLNTVGQMAYSSGGSCEFGDYVFGFLISAAAGYVSSLCFNTIFNYYSFFETTNFFLEYFVEFVTNSDGITLSNSVIAQFICQLAPRAVLVGLANSLFDLPFSWAADSFFNFGKRIINQGIKKNFQEFFAL